MKKGFPLEFVALLGARFNNEVSMYEEYLKVVRIVAEAIRITGITDVASLVTYVYEAAKPEGALAEEKNLTKVVEKMVFYHGTIGLGE